jgi:hypothetical protein
MKTVRMKIDPAAPQTLQVGCIDTARVDATTEADIARQQAEDDAEAMRDAARLRAGYAIALASARRTLRAVSTCRSKRSAIGSKANAARPARQRHC